jgi:RNA polymerase sigma-70 factor (ECF subfamily)
MGGLRRRRQSGQNPKLSRAPRVESSSKYRQENARLPAPDDDLIRLSQSGHRPAFEMLVERTAQLVWSHLLLQARDRALCEDLTQETYLKAWRGINQLDAPENFRRWLLTIADNVRIDAHKKSAAKKRGPRAAGLIAEAVSAEASPDERAEAGELRGRALDALAALPSPHQQAIALRYLGGAEAPEIERQLGVTNGALRGLLHRGLEMLREKLKDELKDDQ